MPDPIHPSNLQRRIHAGGGRVLEQRKSIGVRIHTTPQVGADGKPAEAPHRRAHGDDYPLELRSSLTNRHMKTIDDATGWIFTKGLTQVGRTGTRRGPLLLGIWAATWRSPTIASSQSVKFVEMNKQEGTQKGGVCRNYPGPLRGTLASFPGSFKGGLK